MVLPLLSGLVVLVLLAAYHLLRPRLRCEPVDDRPVVVLHGRITGPKAAGEVVCRVDAGAAGIGEAELPLLVDVSGDKVLVLARGAVVSVRWPHRCPDLRVGDRVAVAGALGNLQRDEALYREPGGAYGVEALHIVAGGLPRVRGLLLPLIVAGGLTLGCLLLLLSPRTRHAPLWGVPCPAGTRLEGKPKAPGTRAWTQICRDARDRAQGPIVRWTAMGMRKSEGYHRDGRLHGPWTVWRAPGSKAIEGAYIAGRRHGLWTAWTSRGRLRSRGHYVRGKKDGRWTVWRDVCLGWGGRRPASTDISYPRWLARLGTVRRMDCHFRAGRLHGPFTLWLQDGTRLDGQFASRGRRGPQFASRGQRGPQFAPGRYHGRWTWRNAAGTRLLQSAYKDGQAHGLWIRWSAAGHRVLVGSYTAKNMEGHMSGRWTRYREDGTVAWACTYADGLAAGWLPPCHGWWYRDPCRNLSARCDARLAGVLPSRPQVRGALSVLEVEQGIYPMLADLSRCHRHSSLRSARSGVVAIGLRIEGGQVAGSWVARSTLRDHLISECVAEVLSRASFRPRSRSTRVLYSLRIRPDRFHEKEWTF